MSEIPHSACGLQTGYVAQDVARLFLLRFHHIHLLSYIQPERVIPRTGKKSIEIGMSVCYTSSIYHFIVSTMTLTKDDLHAISTAIRPVVKEEIRAAITEQSKMIAQGFSDLKAVMEQTYVNREEFEDRYNELQNEVDDLRERMKKLESRLSTP